MSDTALLKAYKKLQESVRDFRVAHDELKEELDPILTSTLALGEILLTKTRRKYGRKERLS